MKINKIKLIAISVALLFSMAACAQDNTGTDNARNNAWDRQNYTNTTIPDDMTGDGFGQQGQDRTGTGTSGNQNTEVPGNDPGNNLNSGMRRPGRLTTSLGNLNNRNSEELAKQISDLPEIERASVVVNENRTIVGIELKNNERQTEISSALRSRIEDMVRDVNNDIEEVSITADEELYNRVDTMATDMLDYDGDFFERMGDAFDDLLDTITPNSRRNR